jgi:ABC-type multidrug transport system ATPase subunit
MDSLRAVNGTDGLTVIVNLHTLDTARQYCDRIVGMFAGRVVFDGTPGQLTPEIVRDMAQSPPEKVINSWNPFMKLPWEVLAGRSLYPKPFEPRELVARVRSVLRRLEPASTAAASQFDGAKDADTVQRLFKHVLTLDALTPSLPHILSRLQSLQSLHANHVHFKQDVASLVASHERILALLHDMKQQLDQLPQQLLDNKACIQQNVDSLSQKLEKAVHLC